MKKYIATTALAIGLGLTAYGQGTIIFGNYQNSSNSPTAISSGLVFTNNNGHIGKISDGVGFTVLAGPDTNSLQVIATYKGNASGGTWFDYGQFSDPAQATKTIATIPSQGMGAFSIQMWWDPTGLYNTYAAAQLGGALWGTATWMNPTGGGTKPPTTFSAMPSIVLSNPVPEPASFALLGLGGAALLVFRRRK